MNPGDDAFIRRKRITVQVRAEMSAELEQIAQDAGMGIAAWITELVESEIADRRLYRLTRQHAAVTQKHYPRVQDGRTNRAS